MRTRQSSSRRHLMMFSTSLSQMFTKEIKTAEEALAKLKCDGKGKKKNKKKCDAARSSLSKAKSGLATMRKDDRKASAETKKAMEFSASIMPSWLSHYIPIPMGYLSSSWRPGSGAASIVAKGMP